MSEIAKRDYQLGLVHKLSNELEALTSTQICQAPSLELETVLMTAVYKAFKDKGQEVLQDQADHIVENLSESVLKACPYIRIAEIPIAIEKGILGDYGDYYGLNVVTFVSFIKKHYSSEKRANNAKQLPVKEEANTIPSEAEILERDKELLKLAFETYRKHGYYEDHGNYIYKIAVKKLKLFELSIDKQREYLEKGKVKAIESFKNELLLKPLDRKRISQCIIDANELVKSTDGLKAVYKESLQLALMNWFHDLTEMEVEIKDLIHDQN